MALIELDIEKLEPYTGLFYFMGLALDVIHINRRLATAVRGVPPGFEMDMEPVGADSFRMLGGPLDGSIVTFTRNTAGDVSGLAAGPIELAKIDRVSLDTLPVSERMAPPKSQLTLTKRAYFEELLQSSLERSDGDWIDYDMPYPKHEFVQYLTTKDILLFHGSNNTEITTFEPVRHSVELRDETGRGNLQAIYATHDGLWAMFFAVVDRSRIKGSIRNGVLYFDNRDGEKLSMYNFSINQEQLAERPYTKGALYLLPRDTFSRLMLTEETSANEWGSEQAVRPIAKLSIEPTDFPFLEQIGGHDDSELARLAAISERIHSAATAALLQEDRFEVTLPPDAEVLGQLDTYAFLLKVWMPAATFSVNETPSGVTLVYGSIPPALQQMFSEDYQDLVSE